MQTLKLILEAGAGEITRPDAEPAPLARDTTVELAAGTLATVRHTGGAALRLLAISVGSEPVQVALHSASDTATEVYLLAAVGDDPSDLHGRSVMLDGWAGDYFVLGCEAVVAEQQPADAQQPGGDY